MSEKEAIERHIAENQKRIDVIHKFTDRQQGAYSKKAQENAIVMEIANRALEEIRQYRAIGTLDECRAAVEKQRAKGLRFIDYDNSYFVCPSCGHSIYSTSELEEHKFCLNCGQAISWEGENEVS